ncbi:MAG TPA: pyruvate ferredoxin oxidoreductase, partial [Candidatus Methanomethylia archaeon]|nr:pyruvate ferredoxin oxidoreductase [Candidatus Methanomethylicia archaeon]
RLANFIDVTKGFKGDLLLINAPSLSELPKDLKAFRLASVDATEIAVKLKLVVAGWPVVNTAMLGALAKASGLVSLNSVVSAIKERWPGRIGELNAEAARRAYQEVLVEVAS